MMGVHRAVHEQAELLLALSHLSLGAQTLQLGGRARGKDPEDRGEPGRRGQRRCVQHGQVAEYPAVDVQERRAHVAHTTHRLQPLDVREQADHVVGDVYELSPRHHGFAGWGRTAPG